MWLDSTSESILLFCQTFPLGANILSQYSSPFQNICHLWETVFLSSHPNSSWESKEVIPAQWRKWWIFSWDHEFPITSESDTVCLLTLFDWAELSVCFWDAVWSFQVALLGLFSLFVGCFNWGRKKQYYRNRYKSRLIYKRGSGRPNHL